MDICFSKTIGVQWNLLTKGSPIFANPIIPVYKMLSIPLLFTCSIVTYPFHLRCSSFLKLPRKQTRQKVPKDLPDVFTKN